ncbi:hypothetical protein DsansV1_C29g0210581 [Dioscorea sansibarensis]
MTLRDSMMQLLSKGGFRSTLHKYKPIKEVGDGALVVYGAL